MATGYDLVTFLTDYGLDAGFVGAMHSVVDRIAAGRREVRIIDLDHSIPPQDVLLGALRMERLLPYTREGVHVVVVDPGVGTKRRGVAVEAGRRVFVGPDNGVLSFALEAAGGATQAVAITTQLGLGPRSATFDGRDVFAPAAAHVACGTPLAELGPPVPTESLARLERPQVVALGVGEVEAVVVQVDRFGNVQFAADREVLEGLGREGGSVGLWRGEHQLVVPIAGTFADVEPGAPLVLVDSDGCIALSVNRGRADGLLGGLRPGDSVRLVASP